MNLQLADSDDFPYIYRLCERTMRAYVEADLGDCFEQLARPAIANLLQRRAFYKVYGHGVLVGAVAYECHESHIQLEELYIEPGAQNQGLGSRVMALILAQSRSLDRPVRLHVLSSNPARAFYEGLGFAVVRSTPKVHHMEHPSSRDIGDA